MEYCFPLWAATQASLLAQLDAVETKAFKINGISHVEAESGLITFPISDRLVVSVLYHLLSGIVPSALSVICPRTPHLDVFVGRTWSTSNPLPVKLPKS